jgi:hypothetical protein
LLAAPTRRRRTPPITAVKSVGVPPKPPSGTRSSGGVRHAPMSDRFSADNATNASACGSGLVQPPGLPVVTKTVPVVSSIVGELQMLAPMQPLGTVLKAASVAPVFAFNFTSLPVTSGQSPIDATPM